MKTKKDIIIQVANDLKVQRNDVEVIINHALEIVRQAILDKEKVFLNNIGTITLSKTKEKECMNFQTGKKVKIPARYTPVARFSASLKEEAHKIPVEE